MQSVQKITRTAAVLLLAVLIAAGRVAQPGKTTNAEAQSGLT